MHTNRVKTKEKQEKNECKIQQSGYFFTGERRDAGKVGYTEGFECASNISLWVIIQVNFITNVYLCSLLLDPCERLKGQPPQIWNKYEYALILMKRSSV